ncbi:MAG: zf-HC2 domain-containing protein [Lachnospiraceae bacterium]|nr:zf-HC2 domain-containing protein [Lachnospiraceae bacterium]
MNRQCEIIQDLLPLYMDNACSRSSVQMIEGHLAECEECAKLLQAMKSNQYEETLRLEKEGVIAHHARREKRRTLAIGAGVTGVFCIPVLVCLIVNLAVGHALDWFFIVLTALMVLASLSVVPLAVGRQRILCTMLSFTVSLLLLLFTCAIYTHGDWFPVTASAVLFGLSVLFMPYLAYVLPLPGFWKRHKGLFVLGTETILFAIMMICIGFYIGAPSYWKIMPPIVLFNGGFLWILFLVCRYLRINRFFRAGLAGIMVGAYTFSIDHVISLILGEWRPWPRWNPGVWNFQTSDGNIKWMVLAGSILIAVVCTAIGIQQRGKR